MHKNEKITPSHGDRKSSQLYLYCQLGSQPHRSQGVKRIHTPTIATITFWKYENIGDVTHVCMLRVFEKYLPDAKLLLVDGEMHPPEKVDLFRREFPDVDVVSLEEAIERGDILIHGPRSGIGFHEEINRWRETGKPYGYFGVTVTSDLTPMIDRLNQAAFLFTREKASLPLLAEAGVEGPVIDFGPDGTLAVRMRNEAAADELLTRKGLEKEGFICVVPRFRYTLNHWLLKGVRGAAEDKERWDYSRRYAEADHAKLRDVLVRWVRETDLKVLLSPELRYNPEMFGPYLYDPLPDDVKANVEQVETFWLPDAAASVDARARCVISLECHSPLIAIANGTPAFYVRQPEDTIKGQMYSDLGVGDWLFEIDSVDGDQIFDRLLDVHRNHEHAQKMRSAAMAMAWKRFEAVAETTREVLGRVQ